MIINFGIFGVAVAVCFVVILVLQIAKYGCGKIFFSEPSDADFKNDIYKVVNKTSLTIIVIAVILSIIGFALAPVSSNKEQSYIGSNKQVEMNMVDVEKEAKIAVREEANRPKKELEEVEKESASGYNDFLESIKQQRESKQ